MIIQSSLSLLKGLVKGPPWTPNCSEKAEFGSICT